MHPEMNCPAYAELERHVQQVLEGGAALVSEEHLSACLRCRVFVDEWSSNLSMANRLREDLLPRFTRLEGNDLPDRIGPFAVEGELGRGGMGVVLLARQVGPNRPVALKIMHPLSMTERSLRRFQLEVESLGQLQHSNIAQIYDSGVHETRGESLPYFAMEYVAGVTLDRFVTASRPDLSVRLSMALDLASAVAHAHRVGLLHRDLKPGNVLVSTAEKRPVVKVIDFGLAKDLTGGSTMRTEAGQVMGTLAFMSPEQAGSFDRPDTRTDVYGLGAVLYYLLCEAPPVDVEGLTLVEALGRIRTRDPLPPSSRNPALERPLDWIVQRCLEKDPGDRYQSAEALIEDLHAYAEGRPIVAAPRSFAYRARLLWRNHKMALVLAAAFVAVVSAGAFGTLRGVFREAAAAERATTASETSTEVRRFLVELFDRGDPTLTGLEDPSARDLVRMGGESILESLVDRPAVRAPLLEDLGDIHRRLGELDEAETLLREALDLRREMNGPESLEHALVQEKLALVYTDRQNAEAAIDLLRESHAHQRAILGAGHPDLVDVTGHLALAYTMDMRFDEAEALFAEAQRLASTQEGAEAALQWRASAARTAAQSGRPHQAVDLLIAAVSEGDEGAAAPHKVAEWRAALASNFVQLGDAERARDNLDKALSVLRPTFGDNHPRTFDARLTEGVVLWMEGDTDGAAEAFRALYDSARDDAGAPLVVAWRARATLANLLTDTGRPAEAVTILEPIVTALAASGTDNPHQQLARYYLARAYLSAARYEEAVEVANAALARWPESDQTTLSIRVQFEYELAVALSHLDRHSEVIQVLEGSIARTDDYASANPDLAVAARLQLVASRQQIGVVDGCLEALEPAVELAERIDPHSERALQFWTMLAWAYDVNGRPPDAVPYLRRALATRRTVHGDSQSRNPELPERTCPLPGPVGGSGRGRGDVRRPAPARLGGPAQRF